MAPMMLAVAGVSGPGTPQKALATGSRVAPTAMAGGGTLMPIRGVGRLKICGCRGQYVFVSFSRDKAVASTCNSWSSRVVYLCLLLYRAAYIGSVHHYMCLDGQYNRMLRSPITLS